MNAGRHSLFWIRIAWLLTKNELQSMPMDGKKGIRIVNMFQWYNGNGMLLFHVIFRQIFRWRKKRREYGTLWRLIRREPNKANKYATNRYYASFSFQFISYLASKKNIYLIHWKFMLFKLIVPISFSSHRLFVVIFVFPFGFLFSFSSCFRRQNKNV